MLGGFGTPWARGARRGFRKYLLIKATEAAAQGSWCLQSYLLLEHGFIIFIVHVVLASPAPGPDQGRALYGPIPVKTETFRELWAPLVHTTILDEKDTLLILKNIWHVANMYFLHLIICWNFHHVFVTCWRVRSCFTEVPRKKASMDPLRMSIKLEWTHEFSSNSRGFSGQSIRILFQFPEPRESTHFLLDFPIFLGNPYNFLWVFPCFSRESMQFSVDFPRFFKGIHAIFCGFSWIFPGFCRESIGCSQVFLGSQCTFSADFPRIVKGIHAIFCRFSGFSRESMQFSVGFSQVVLGNPCVVCGFRFLGNPCIVCGNPCIVCGFRFSWESMHCLWVFPGFFAFFVDIPRFF